MVAGNIMPGIWVAIPASGQAVGNGIFPIIGAITRGISHIGDTWRQRRTGIPSRTKILINHRVAQTAIAGLAEPF